MLDAASITIVLDGYRPERVDFVELLRDLDASALALPTECPAYDDGREHAATFAPCSTLSTTAGSRPPGS